MYAGPASKGDLLQSLVIIETRSTKLFSGVCEKMIFFKEIRARKNIDESCFFSEQLRLESFEAIGVFEELFKDIF